MTEDHTLPEPLPVRCIVTRHDLARRYRADARTKAAADDTDLANALLDRARELER